MFALLLHSMGSIDREYNIPERGQPCLNPRHTLKGALSPPLISSTLSMSHYKTWIMALRPGLRPKTSRVFQR